MLSNLKIMKNRGHCHFKTNINEFLFCIQNVTKNDGGEYKVAAKNEFGEGSATITVNMDQVQ